MGSAATRIEGPAGVSVYPGYLDEDAQRAVMAAAADVVAAAPFFTPRMPRTGKPFSVRMTNAGPLGWLSDARGGYRYQAVHPETGRAWPPIPEAIQAIWQNLSGYPAPPEACLVNHYEPGARMGLHQDRDEETFEAPVVSVSLGDTAVFRVGGRRRRDPTQSLRLASGDVVVLAGDARLCHHGIDRVLGGSSRLLEDFGFAEGGRINLTLRRVTRPA